MDYGLTGEEQEGSKKGARREQGGGGELKVKR